MPSRSKELHLKILSILHQQKGSLTAYEILGELKEFNPKIAPQTVYRALSSLADDRKIHRIESLNSYVACRHEHKSNPPILSICDDCGVVQENNAEEIVESLSDIVSKKGFSPQSHVIEVYGVCSSCEN